MLASGLFNTFISLRMELEGHSHEVIGMVASALYLGIFLGSLGAHRWIERVGHRQAFIQFAAISAAVILLQSLWIHPFYWGLLRIIGGIALAGIFIVIESWLLILGNPQNRGAILSAYLAVFYLALSLGQFLINAANPLGVHHFYIAAFFCALSIVPMQIGPVQDPKIENSVRMSLLELFRLSPHGFIGGVISGMVLAAVYGLVPVFAKEAGLSIGEIGTLMAVIIFGGVSLQWPMGKLADRTDRRRVLNGASFLSALLAFAIGIVDHPSYLALLAMAWGFGGCSFTLYPLSMAYTCERVQENQIVAATGGFVLSYSMGAIVGPLAAPLAMDWLGSNGLFYFLSAITAGLGLIGLKKRRVQEPVE
jgi:MFS family permease